MATIALYANKINQMPGLIKDVKQSVIDYKSELSALKTKTLTVNKSVCNLDDVISSIQTSTQTQEQKIASLDTFNQNSENFISDVVRIDSNVADVIRQRKDEFYDKYYYLKPECEKDWKEYAKDLFDTACEWCKEHWKAIVTGFIVVAAIVCLFIPGVNALVAGLVFGKLMLAMALGALIGAGVGGLLGGTMSAITGGSFWEGFENGAFGGAIAGLISGGMAFTFTGGVAGVSLTLSQTLLIGAVSGGGSSLIGDLGDKFFNGADISWGQMLLNTAFSAALGAAFAGVFYGLSKGFAALKLKFINGKANLPEAVGMVDDVVEGTSGGNTLSNAEAEEAAFNAIKGPNKADDVVLGKYDGGGPTAYSEVAKDIDAQYFELDNWNELSANYSEAEIWKINEKFSDIQTSSGREIYLSHNPSKYMGDGSFYSKEIQYLMDNGYHFIQEGGLWHAVR